MSQKKKGKETMRLVLIGLGGIGSHLAEPVCRTLHYTNTSRTPKRIVLIDGDTYDRTNSERQRSQPNTKKGDATKESLAPLFPELRIEAKNLYINEDNVYVHLLEEDIILLAVDNHASRKIVSHHVCTLKNCILISGGNEEVDGAIQVYERRNGQDVTPPLTKFHPEIEYPKNNHPETPSCAQLIETESPQLLTVNFTIAALMLNALTLWLHEKPSPYADQYFDLHKGIVSPVHRNP
ncbi:MAG: ThiF family adenylyltransferase [Parcubacteria group bacterium]|nr:ThiF family adenylyltransferase [Parcubacteria group bacterium]